MQLACATGIYTSWANVGFIQVRGVTDVQVHGFNCSNNLLTTTRVETGVVPVLLSCLLLVQEPSNADNARLHIEDVVIQDNSVGARIQGYHQVQ
jgi:hypothetical protein